MAPLRVVVNGAQGRMGKTTVHALTADPRFVVVGEGSRSDDLKELIKNTGAQIVVDFTEAGCGEEHTRKILEAGARPVIGTSGFTEESVKPLQAFARECGLGGVIAPNFALGAVLLIECAKKIAKYLPSCEIIELHHDRKIDAPSGTARRTAELLSQVGAHSPQPGVHTAQGERVQEVQVHSIRLPGLVAHQKILFGGHGELVTLQHDSTDRSSFMPGVVLACAKVMELPDLVFGLEDIL